MLLLAHLYTQESALLAGGQMIRCVLCCASSSQLAPWTTQLPGSVATPDSMCMEADTALQAHGEEGDAAARWMRHQCV
jgi:hypothetical protein